MRRRAKPPIASSLKGCARNTVTAVSDHGFWVSLKNLSSVQIDSLRSLVRRAKHAHYVEIMLREGGRDVNFNEADWVKHLEPRIDYQRLFLQAVSFMAHRKTCESLQGPADVGRDLEVRCNCGYDSIIREANRFDSSLDNGLQRERNVRVLAKHIDECARMTK
jgi:hypothetical protein